jgi:selenocysteine lyase/cysteine desulfurase
MPHKHAPGTPSFEAQGGTQGAIEHMAWLGERFGGAVGGSLRAQLEAGYRAAIVHETALSKRFLDGVSSIPGVTLYGIANPAAVAARVPTFSLRLSSATPLQVAERFASENIYVWAGTFYAYELSGRLGVREDGGVVRIGFAHYNTAHEVDRILELLDGVARAR